MTYSPHNWVGFHPLYTLNNFIAQVTLLGLQSIRFDVGFNIIHRGETKTKSSRDLQYLNNYSNTIANHLQILAPTHHYAGSVHALLWHLTKIKKGIEEVKAILLSSNSL